MARVHWQRPETVEQSSLGSNCLDQEVQTGIFFQPCREKAMLMRLAHQSSHQEAGEVGTVGLFCFI